MVKHNVNEPSNDEQPQGLRAVEKIQYRMEEYRVVPDVTAKKPRETAVVKYGADEVNIGNELTPTQVKDPPTSIKWSTEEGALYTLLFTDPDIPPQYPFRQFHHWLVVNIPGHDIAKGTTLYDYVGSGPPKGSGLHRYVFLVYKQSARLGADTLSTIVDHNMADRAIYPTQQLCEVLHLDPTPVAGNFYRAQYDDYVLVLQQKLGERYGGK